MSFPQLKVISSIPLELAFVPSRTDLGGYRESTGI